MHVERMDEYRLARRVLMAEISGGPVRGRPRLDWMDSVKVAFGKRGMTMEAARKIGKSGEPGYISGGALVCEACKSCQRHEFESRVKWASQFKKSQTAVSTTERYFTHSAVCLIVECARRHRKGN